MPATFELFQESSHGWRWRLQDDAGNTIADGTESYASAAECRRVVHTVRQNAFKAELRETSSRGSYKPSKSDPGHPRPATPREAERDPIERKNPFSAAA